MPAFEQRVIKVSPETGSRLTEIRDTMAREKRRQVTYAETVEYLIDFRDQALGLGLSTAAGR
jgi:hypothetical protein